jgi:dTDP-glucose 4,6-dehydratase
MYGDGLYVRDWIHVRDHAKALDLLLEKGNAGETYNIGSDNERNNLDITKMILKVLGKDEEKNACCFEANLLANKRCRIIIIIMF